MSSPLSLARIFNGGLTSSQPRGAKTEEWKQPHLSISGAGSKHTVARKIIYEVHRVQMART